MTEDNMYDDLLVNFRSEFIDEAEDNLNVVDIILENLRSDSEEKDNAITKIRRIAHSLKGSSAVTDFPVVTMIMHRLEDYLAGAKYIEGEAIDDVQIYIDEARKYSSLDIEQKSVSTADIARNLPAKNMPIGEADNDEKKQQRPENILQALVVIKERAAGLLFERELRASWVRATTIHNSLDAIEMTIRTRPDIVIISGVLDVLSGIDVACAISAMPTTKDIAVCLLTSFDRDHQELKSLPKSVFIIKKNNFSNGLKEALVAHKLTG